MHDDRARRDKRRLPPRHNRETGDLHIGQGDSVDSTEPSTTSRTRRCLLSDQVQHDAPAVPQYRRVTLQESRVLDALTDCRATSRRRWYLPYALVGLHVPNCELFAGRSRYRKERNNTPIPEFYLWVACATLSSNSLMCLRLTCTPISITGRKMTRYRVAIALTLTVGTHGSRAGRLKTGPPHTIRMDRTTCG